MREGAADVLAPQFLVEPDRGVDVLHDRRRAGGEAAAPLLVGRSVSAIGIVVQRKDSAMALTTRRMVVAVGATLAATLPSRKPQARELPELAKVLVPTNPPRTPPEGVFVD